MQHLASSDPGQPLSAIDPVLTNLRVRGKTPVRPLRHTLLLNPGDHILLLNPGDHPLLLNPGDHILLLKPGDHILLLKPGDHILLLNPGDHPLPTWCTPPTPQYPPTWCTAHPHPLGVLLTLTPLLTHPTSPLPVPKLPPGVQGPPTHPKCARTHACRQVHKVPGRPPTSPLAAHPPAGVQSPWPSAAEVRDTRPPLRSTQGCSSCSAGCAGTGFRGAVG